VLEEIGIEFLNDEALDYFKKAGCKIEDQNVKMDRAWVMEMLSHAPSEFDITPRNPERKITIGGKHMCFVNVSSPPNVMDLDRGHRVGDFESFKDLMKLTQYFNCIHVRGQMVSVTPFTLAGAMAPVTMPGAVVQFLAEGLAAIALLQFIRPGCPCVLGSFTSNVDMKSGAPAFGTPEYVRATQISGQMARHYGLPLRASNACAANAPDGQAMMETMNSMWANVNSRVNLVYHSAGWLEGGLIASYEKFVMDCEMLQQFQRYFESDIVDWSKESLAVDAIRDVGPDGHFFGCDHTQHSAQTRSGRTF